MQRAGTIVAKHKGMECERIGQERMGGGVVEDLNINFLNIVVQNTSHQRMEHDGMVESLKMSFRMFVRNKNGRARGYGVLVESHEL